MTQRRLKFKTPEAAESSFLSETINELERLKNEVGVKNYLRWSGGELGVGFTPLLELPLEVNPHINKDIHIFYKPEFLNYGGSGKGRPVSFMLYYYLKKGILNDLKMITTAGFGNFMRALTELIPLIHPTITPKAHMGQILVEENTDFIKYLHDRGAVIDACDDGYCPTGDMDRGKAISNAFIEEQINPNVLMLDQHAVYKPLDGLLNAAGYFGLALEILYQTSSMENLYYVNGEGTRGSLVGIAAGLRKARPNTQIIGLRQKEGGHIFGLRSKNQLGKSESLGRAEELCNAVYEISDYEAYATMIRLWMAGVPATPSGGSYVAGALKLADELKGGENIVTLVFDSLEFYQSILNVWIPKILGSKLDATVFNDLKTQVLQERATHISRLKKGENRLYNSLMTNNFE
ncbi:MAG: PLP-dependent lyase/thiolase [Candidatus Bathyarchaeia archaeon]